MIQSYDQWKTASPYDNQPEHCLAAYVATEGFENLREWGHAVDKHSTVFILFKVNDDDDEVWSTSEAMPDDDLEGLIDKGQIITDVGVSGIVEGSDAEVGPYWHSKTCRPQPGQNQYDQAKAQWDVLVNHVDLEQMRLWKQAHTEHYEITVNVHGTTTHTLCASLKDWDDDVVWTDVPDTVDDALLELLQEAISQRHNDVVTDEQQYMWMPLASADHGVHVHVERRLTFHVRGTRYSVEIRCADPDSML